MAAGPKIRKRYRQMKATALDYLLSIVVITVMLMLALIPVLAVHSAVAAWINPYHVLVEAALFLLGYGLASALAVRVLLHWRPIPAGTHSGDSPVFSQWKLVTVTYRLGQGALRPFIPVFLQPLQETLFGARIGRDVALGGIIDDPYAVTVGDGTVLGNASLVSANYVAGGQLVCGAVRIGARVTVGANSVIYPATEIGDDATLMVGSVLMPGSRVPAGETWRGNPARRWMGG